MEFPCVQIIRAGLLGFLKGTIHIIPAILILGVSAGGSPVAYHLAGLDWMRAMLASEAAAAA